MSEENSRMMPSGEDFNDYLRVSCIGVCGIQRRGRRRQPREPVRGPVALIGAPRVESAKMAESALVRLSTRCFRVTDVSRSRRANDSKKSDANVASRSSLTHRHWGLYAHRVTFARTRARTRTPSHTRTHG